MDDLLTEFLTETSDSLDRLDVEIVKLEQNPNDPDLLGNIFRLVHTIKGTCGFIGLSRLEAVAHAGENVLGNFRDGVQEVSPEAVSLILAALDRIKEIVSALGETETEPDGDDGELIARLDAMYRAGRDSVPADAAAPESAAAPAVSLYEQVGGTSVIDAAVELMYGRILADPELAAYFEGVDMTRLKGCHVALMVHALGGPDDHTGGDLTAVHAHLGKQGLNRVHFLKVAEHLAAALNAIEVPPHVIDQVVALVATPKDAVLGGAADAELSAQTPAAAVAEEPAEHKAAAGQAMESSVANQSIRVNVELLEDLMTMVSELVLTRNQLLQMVRKHEDSEFKVPLQRLSHVTTELQEGIMKTRMQPIGNAWNKLPRIVRDIANELGKKIDLDMLGANTELDRQVLEMIRDPLTHMVRNSGDHGLETPSERAAAGKPETGTITLKAYHEGGYIIIEIRDDGRGISIEKVKAKAIANGLATRAELDAMPDRQIQQFIFRAGFSTAEEVTNVSGRGVGMDVVRTNIEKIGGQIRLRSVEGHGSTFIIKIPLTLAIVSALIVRCGTERFAIPQLSVLELVRVAADCDRRIEKVNQTPVLRLRDRLLPLVSLSELLHLGSHEFMRRHDTDAAADRETDGRSSAADKFIVVARVGAYSFGIIVDEVLDTEEIVVKPVAPILRNIPVYSGNTILGDGSVIMILDPNGIAAATGELTISDQAEVAMEAAGAAHGAERMPILVFRAGGAEPKAVPLVLVSRLEEIDVEAIEVSSGSPVVQYRGQLMPLVAVADGAARRSEGRQPVLVFTDRDWSIGLMVDEILDIVEDHLNIEIAASEEGILGSAVVDGKATQIIDAGYYLSSAFKDWFERSDSRAAAGRASGRILLVDDSPFFRNLMAPLLRAAGYDVTTAGSGDDALALRDAGEAFDVIVSDIEMPGMDGCALARTLREAGPWKETPLIALSSRTAPADIARGREVGFEDCIGKIDRDALLDTISSTITRMKGAA